MSDPDISACTNTGWRIGPHTACSVSVIISFSVMVAGKKVVSLCVSKKHFKNVQKALAVKITKKVAHEAQKKIGLRTNVQNPIYILCLETYPLKNAKGSHA